MAKQEYEAPDADAVKDVRLYWRLQREAQAREDAEQRRREVQVKVVQAEVL